MALEENAASEGNAMGSESNKSTAIPKDPFPLILVKLVTNRILALRPVKGEQCGLFSAAPKHHTNINNHMYNYKHTQMHSTTNTNKRKNKTKNNHNKQQQQPSSGCRHSSKLVFGLSSSGIDLARPESWLATLSSSQPCRTTPATPCYATKFGGNTPNSSSLPDQETKKTTRTVTTPELATDVAATSHSLPHVDEWWEYVDLDSPLLTAEYRDLESLFHNQFPDFTPRLTSLLEAITQKLSQELSVAQIVRDMALEHRFRWFGSSLATFVLRLTKKRRQASGGGITGFDINGFGNVFCTHGHSCAHFNNCRVSGISISSFHDIHSCSSGVCNFGNSISYF